MPDSSFIAYVGEPDFHDGSILSVEQQDDAVCIRVRGASGKVFRLDFSGVRTVRANAAVGMVLYALSEMSAQPPIGRFVFVNWDEQGDAHLEIDAVGLVIEEE